MAEARELLRLTPVYEVVEDGWVQATLRELPGVVTAGPTQAEAEVLLLDALREFLLSFGPGESPDGSLALSVRIA